MHDTPFSTVFRRLLALLAVLLLTPAAAAQFGQPTTAGRPGAGGEPEVQFSAAVSQAQAAPGTNLVIAGVITHAEKWHTNLHEPVVPEALAGFVPVPTRIEATLPEGFTLGPIQWPKPHAAMVDFLLSGSPIEYLVYDGVAPIFLPIRIADSVEPGTYEILLVLSYQACDDRICLMPTSADASVTLEVVAESEAIAAGDTPAIFADFEAAVFEADWVVSSGEDPTQADTTAQDDAASTTGETATTQAASGATSGSLLGISLGSGFFALALLAFLGGAILNLTPCVLPMIPIKIMTLSSHAGEKRGRTLALGLSMFFGVTAFWAALGIPAALIAEFADPSRIFGLWYVTVPLGVLIVLLALGMMGLFQLTLPQSTYKFNPKADNMVGSFLFGVLTAVFGLPCFGFVAGALIPAAVSLGDTAVITIFTALGLGMGAPYLILAAFPKLVERVPKAGPASELVKQVLGLIMAGFGVFFLGTGIRAMVKTYPYTADSLHIYGLALLIIAAGLWLVWQTFKITKSPAKRGAFGLLGLAVAALATYNAVSSTQKHRTDYLERQAAIAAAGGVRGSLLPTLWNDYTPALLEQALEQNMVVFVDFTADWCINCKVFEAQVLDKEPVRSLLRSESVAMLKVDMTGANPDGAKLLDELGRVGLPTWAVLGPELAEPILVTNYTPQAVLAAIEAARPGTPGTAFASNP